MNHPDRKRKIAIAIALVLLLLAGGCIVWTQMPKRAEAPDEPVTQAVHDYTDPLPAQDNKPNEADDNTKGSDSDSVGTEDDDASGDQNAQGANQQGGQAAGTTPAAPATPQQTTDANTQPQVPTQPAAPAAHTHNWVAITQQKWVVDKAAYDEQVLVKEAWDETRSIAKEVPDYDIWVCNCGHTALSADGLAPHLFAHLEADEPSNYHVDTIYKTVWENITEHHDAEYKTVHHEEVGHYETITTGHRCSTCGATK